MKTILFAVNQSWRPTIWLARDEQRIARAGKVLPVPAPQTADKGFLLRHIAEAHILITSWDTAALDAEVMAKAGNLELLVHAAGSVKPVVSDALWDRGVKVASMAPAIADGVAEYCLGFILLAPKRAFWGAQGTRHGQWADAVKVFNGPHEIYAQKIGVIGAGHVGRRLIRLLKNFTCDVVLFDPYVTEAQAKELGVTKAGSLDEVFAECIAVSLNAPSTEETKGMIRGRHFALMPKGATFINTARGAIVNEQELAEELAKGNFVACLDVTQEEPPPADHPFRKLPNVVLTPHVAGVAAENRLRIGAMAADEIEAYAQGRSIRYEVTRAQLARIG